MLVVTHILQTRMSLQCFAGLHGKSHLPKNLRTKPQKFLIISDDAGKSSCQQ